MSLGSDAVYFLTAGIFIIGLKQMSSPKWAKSNRAPDSSASLTF